MAGDLWHRLHAILREASQTSSVAFLQELLLRLAYQVASLQRGCCWRYASRSQKNIGRPVPSPPPLPDRFTNMNRSPKRSTGRSLQALPAQLLASEWFSVIWHILCYPLLERQVDCGVLRFPRGGGGAVCAEHTLYGAESAWHTASKGRGSA